MEKLLKLIRDLGPVRISVVMIVLAILAAFFAYITTQISKPVMAPLFMDLQPGDSAKIISQLDSMNIDYELNNEDSTIFVPKDRVSWVRMQLAEEGLAIGGTIGYEIFDRSEGLGVTNFVQDLNRLRALEGELARTISTLKPVASARVHLVIPQKALFAKDNKPPTASVILRMRAQKKLFDQQIQAIKHLVASAVPDMNPDYISIVDDRGQLLSRGSTEGGESLGINLQKSEEMRANYEQRLSRSIETLLEQTLGPGKVRVEVRAEMDFDRLTENSESFDPQGKVIRSTQISEEGSDSRETSPSTNTLTVQNNLPEGQAAPAESGGQNQSKSKHTDQTTNYEISKMIRSRVKEIGNLKRLSVAVLVDGNYTKGADNNSVYAPRDPQEMEKLTAIVKSAIGYQKDRGDVVEVTNMRFALPELLADMPSNEIFLGFTRQDLLRMFEVLLLIGTGITVALVVLRPLVKDLFTFVAADFNAGRAMDNETLVEQVIKRVKVINEGSTMTDPSSSPPPSYSQSSPSSSSSPSSPSSSPSASSLPPSPTPDKKPDNSVITNIIGHNKIQGELKEMLVKQIGDVISAHPQESLSMVRSWMSQR